MNIDLELTKFQRESSNIVKKWACVGIFYYDLDSEGKSGSEIVKGST